jgi:aspartyl-tRNA(Asn)/glutamyl-tRNA(Gln) amidotransferase subunit A
LSAESKIASSLAKSVYPVKLRYYKDLEDIMKVLKEIENNVEELGLKSDFLEKIINRKYDQKEVEAIANKVCNEGVNTKAVIACKRSPSVNKRGLLANVPILVKDNIEIHEFPLTLGTSYYKYLPYKDSEIVAKLRSAGVIFLGITNMHELALGTTGVNPHYGTPLNPLCPDRIPGGSSSGSASAVAQGLVPIALGNDAGGSVRVPAAFTGIVGFKFSRDFVSPRGSRPELSQLSSIGVFSKSSIDLIPIFEVLKEGSSVNVLDLINLYKKERIRVFIPKNFLNMVQEPVLSLFNEVIEMIKNIPNIELKEGELPLPDYVERARVIITLSDSFYDYLEIYDKYKDFASEDVNFLLEIGLRIPAWSYIKAKEIIKEYKDRVMSELIRYDVIIMPTTSREPPKIEEADWKLATSTKLIEMTTIWNILEFAAVNLPTPLRLSCGAKLGIQLASAKGDENLLALSILFESGLREKS